MLLFFIKNKSVFKNQNIESGGLYNGDTLVKDLVSIDTDGDGVLDWEEGLWGTDPTKKDTDEDGVGDRAEIAQMKPQGAGQEGEIEENLTETDKFSRELFTTVAALNQAGQIDQETVDKLSESIVNRIKNSPPEKVYLPSELNIISDNSSTAFQKYIATIGEIYKKYPATTNVTAVLEEFVNDGVEVKVEALTKLDPAVEQTERVVGEMLKMQTPSEIASTHLTLVNTLEQLRKNMSDLQLFDTDPIIAMSAISQYEENVGNLETTLGELGVAVKKKIGS